MNKSGENYANAFDCESILKMIEAARERNMIGDMFMVDVPTLYVSDGQGSLVRVSAEDSGARIRYQLEQDDE